PLGTTSAATVTLEDCTSCGVAGWGWQDNGYGASVLGPNITFATTGSQTIRVQTREDGVAIDQIILSPSRFLTTPPGTLKNDTTIYPPTSGTPPPSGPSEVVLYASRATTIAGAWQVEADATAAGGALIRHPDAGAAKLITPLAAPVN